MHNDLNLSLCGHIQSFSLYSHNPSTHSYPTPHIIYPLDCSHLRHLPPAPTSDTTSGTYLRLLPSAPTFGTTFQHLPSGPNRQHPAHGSLEPPPPPSTSLTHTHTHTLYTRLYLNKNQSMIHSYRHLSARSQRNRSTHFSFPPLTPLSFSLSSYEPPFHNLS